MLRKKATLTGMRRREELTAWLFIAPVALGVLIFQLYPTLFSLYISFTRWNLLSPPTCNVLTNYVDLFTTDRFFFQAMGNTRLHFALALCLGEIIGRDSRHSKVRTVQVYQRAGFVQWLVERLLALVEREAIESSDNWIVRREILSSAETLYASV